VSDVIAINLADVAWYVTNDGVMGGLSRGKITSSNNVAIFSGEISTEHNGGFTSTFKPIPKLPVEISTMKISVKGDGNDYQLRLKSQLMGFSIAYKVMLSTQENKTVSYLFQLTDFIATHRGRALATAPTLLADTITELGFLIASKTPKQFILNVYSLEFY
jgi:hypothetical protein